MDVLVNSSTDWLPLSLSDHKCCSDVAAHSLLKAFYVGSSFSIYIWMPNDMLVHVHVVTVRSLLILIMRNLYNEYVRLVALHYTYP